MEGLRPPPGWRTRRGYHTAVAQLTLPKPNRALCQACGLGDGSHIAMAQGLRFAGCPQLSRAAFPSPGLCPAGRGPAAGAGRLGHALLSVRQGVPCGACGPTPARGGRTQLVEKAV